MSDSHSCGWWLKLAGQMKHIAGRMKYPTIDKWLEDMRQSLIFAVSIIATITFQSALNPPGGVIQGESNEVLRNCTSSPRDPCPGQAVLAAVYPSGYHAFLVCNTISFIASLSVCLLLVSGLYLNHKFTTWLLLLCMWISITGLALSYLFGAAMVTPFVVHVTTSVFGNVVLVWILLLAVLGLLLIIGFVAWVWNTPEAGNGSSAKEMTSTSGPQTL